LSTDLGSSEDEMERRGGALGLEKIMEGEEKGRAETDYAGLSQKTKKLRSKNGLVKEQGKKPLWVIGEEERKDFNED